MTERRFNYLLLAILCFVGIYWASGGALEWSVSGGLTSVYYKNGDSFGAGELTYAGLSGREISIYATGAEITDGFGRLRFGTIRR